MKIEYSEVPLETVMRHYADGFKPKSGKIFSIEWFLDPAKKKVIFRLCIEEPPDNRPG